MKRRLGFLLMTAMLVFAGGTVGHADPFAAALPAAYGHDGVVLAGDLAAEKAERAERTEAMEDRKEERSEGKLRKGFGARIWGPFWGYGPSFGRRCDNCQAECAGEERDDSARCRRCRIRCGD